MLKIRTRSRFYKRNQQIQPHGGQKVKLCRTGTPRKINYTRLDKDAMVDVIDGAALLGAGGGGPKQMAYEMLKTGNDKQVTDLAPLAKVGDGDWVITAAFLGSPDAAHKIQQVSYKSTTRAVEALQKACGHEAHFVAPVEVGAVNSVAPMLVSWDLGLPVVDADGAGRAVPTLSCLTFSTNDKLLQDGVTVANETQHTDDGQEALFNVNNASEAESLAGAVVQTTAFRNLGGLAIWMMQGNAYKKLAIGNGISNARSLGQKLREQRKKDRSGTYNEVTIKELTELGLKARVIGSSLTTVSYASTTENALDHGLLKLKNRDGDRYSIYIVNENMYAYNRSVSAPLIMSPDMICYLLSDGTTLDNSELQSRIEGGETLNLSLIGIEANDALKSEHKIVNSYLDIFEQLGYAGKYVPFSA